MTPKLVCRTQIHKGPICTCSMKNKEKVDIKPLQRSMCLFPLNCPNPTNKVEYFSTAISKELVVIPLVRSGPRKALLMKPVVTIHCY